MPPLSLEQAESLAPDSGTLSRARKIAKASKYQNVGQSERALWGTALGSKPYESYVDLNGPAYKCSCPVKKLPCKHIMGLMLLIAAEPAEARSETPPQPLTEWLQKRDSSAQAKASKAAAKATGSGVKDSAAQAQRNAGREANVQQGIDELKRFLEDIVSIGLLETQKSDHTAWEQMRRRLVDAQANGLARQLEQIRTRIGTSGDWTQPVLTEIARLHNLIRAWENRARLPAALQDEVRSRIGWSTPRDSVIARAEHQGHWLILTDHTLRESDLYQQHIWLIDRLSGKLALQLNFATSQNINPLTKGLIPGRSLHSALGYYNETYPQRAELAECNSMQQQPVDDYRWLADYASAGIRQAVTGFQQTRARLPFSGVQPMLINNLRLVLKNNRLALADRDNCLLLIDDHFIAPWQLPATTMGQETTFFVTSDDGISVQPWGCLQNNQWTCFSLKESLTL